MVTYYLSSAGLHRGSGAYETYSFIGPHSVIEGWRTLGQRAAWCLHSCVSAAKFPDFAILAGSPATVVGDTRDSDA